ncbi:MAG: hypothetical protein B7X83_06730 [Polynucleobacter sp. 17-46-58]|nr:MAG: hypothetical protein B7X83_06730 [Polynucleobacter sp. 17-46-58]
MAGGFLNRWSRRKAGEQLEPEQKPALEPTQDLAKSAVIKDPVKEAQDVVPALTLEDVEKLDRFAPDFSDFMKKMFSDPHFNIMDGLDIYIDDYSKPDPIPMEMLKRMVQSDMLNIFSKDDDKSVDKQPEILSADKSGHASEQALPLVDRTDLTSTQIIPDDGESKPDTMPANKKTS